MKERLPEFQRKSKSWKEVARDYNWKSIDLVNVKVPGATKADRFEIRPFLIVEFQYNYQSLAYNNLNI